MIYGCSQGNATHRIKEWIVGDTDESKVIDSEGDWTLEKMEAYVGVGGFASTRARYVSRIKHACDPDSPRLDGQDYSTLLSVVVYPDDNDSCWRCGELVPDKMVVLWTFMNADQIQYRKNQYNIWRFHSSTYKK